MAPGVGIGNILITAWRIFSTKSYKRLERGQRSDGQTNLLVNYKPTIFLELKPVIDIVLLKSIYLEDSLAN